MVYGDYTGAVKGLSMKLNRLIKAVEESLQEMEQSGYTEEVKGKLVRAIEKARSKQKSRG